MHVWTRQILAGKAGAWVHGLKVVSVMHPCIEQSGFQGSLFEHGCMDFHLKKSMQSRVCNFLILQMFLSMDAWMHGHLNIGGGRGHPCPSSPSPEQAEPFAMQTFFLEVVCYMPNVPWPGVRNVWSFKRQTEHGQKFSCVQNEGKSYVRRRIRAGVPKSLADTVVRPLRMVKFSYVHNRRHRPELPWHGVGVGRILKGFRLPDRAWTHAYTLWKFWRVND